MKPTAKKTLKELFFSAFSVNISEVKIETIFWRLHFITIIIFDDELHRVLNWTIAADIFGRWFLFNFGSLWQFYCLWFSQCCQQTPEAVMMITSANGRSQGLLSHAPFKSSAKWYTDVDYFLHYKLMGRDLGNK